MKNDAQECRNDIQKHRMTPRMTPKKRMNSLLLKQTSEMIVWGGAINDCFGKKIRWYTTPMKVQNLSSFEKQKEYVLTLLRNSY